VLRSCYEWERITPDIRDMGAARIPTFQSENRRSVRIGLLSSRNAHQVTRLGVVNPHAIGSRVRVAKHDQAASYFGGRRSKR
jgi:hypothetical protein